MTIRPYRVKPLTKERFLLNIKEEPGSLETNCWVWQKAKNKSTGYGVLTITKNDKTRTVSAHRASYELFIGQVPEGLSVLHRCDNRPCINPHHLFLGDDQDNSDDCIAKNRHHRGERSGMSKLTDQKVNEIRRLLTETQLTVEEISNKFGIYIGHIYRGESWKHLGPVTWPKRVPSKGEKVGTSKLTDDKVMKIRFMLSEGTIKSKIAKKFGVSTDLIRLISRGLSWRHLYNRPVWSIPTIIEVFGSGKQKIIEECSEF